MEQTQERGFGERIWDFQFRYLGSIFNSAIDQLCGPRQVTTCLSLSFLICKMGPDSPFLSGFLRWI